ncbi:MAG: OsmC family protein [Chloroflexi bacterium]|nr:OsmC family protein [Chloroflexota bacterium]
MTSFSYQQLVHDTAAALGAAPDAAVATFRAESGQESGLRSRVTTRSFELDVDEPPSLGGTDTAPNPVEYALAALATCQEITYRLHADALGIPLDGVSVALEGEIDLRGFFAVDPAVRPGFRAIRGTVTLDSPAGKAEIARLKAYVDAHCPVLDLVSNATPVELELRAGPGADEAAAA